MAVVDGAFVLPIIGFTTRIFDLTGVLISMAYCFVYILNFAFSLKKKFNLKFSLLLKVALLDN